MTPPSSTSHVRVRYAETDQMGVVYYSNYLVWMELGRAEYCREAGVRYKEMETEDGVRLAVVDAHCRYSIRRAMTKRSASRRRSLAPIAG